MRRPGALAFSTVLLGAALARGGAAFTSPNYEIESGHFVSGGGTRASASARVEDTIGQWTYESSASPNFRIVTTFWVPEPASCALQIAAVVSLAVLVARRRR